MQTKNVWVACYTGIFEIYKTDIDLLGEPEGCHFEHHHVCLCLFGLVTEHHSCMH